MKSVKLALCLCVTLVLFGSFVSAVEQDKATPVIVIEEPIYNFKQVSQGETVKHDFKVFNKGAAPLEIKSVKPG